MRWLALALLGCSLVAVMSRPEPVSACSPLVMDRPGRFDQSFAVFQGRVADQHFGMREESVGTGNGAPPHSYRAAYTTFTIEQVWKGPIVSAVEVHGMLDNMCAGFFQPGRGYVVWAERRADGSMSAFAGYDEDPEDLELRAFLDGEVAAGNAIPDAPWRVRRVASRDIPFPPDVRVLGYQTGGGCRDMACYQQRGVILLMRGQSSAYLNMATGELQESLDARDDRPFQFLKDALQATP